ncbi:putative pectin lyase F-2 [Fusarium oxysporum f. sp. albedinis]|jgi:hypothetical protein|nr:putative pectin lyase F-2 [Fusarium oxysporum f. sp. albedinis]
MRSMWNEEWEKEKWDSRLEIVDHVDIFGLSAVIDWPRRGLISAYQCIDHSQTRVRSSCLHSTFFNFVFASAVEIA